MKLVFLGTGSAHPTKKRGLSCVCLDTDKEILVFDIGEGAQAAYLNANLKWNKKMNIFITHLHGDHCLGILGMLQTMSLQKRDQEVRIYGPRGMEEFILENCRMLGFTPVFPLMITELDGTESVKGNGYTVSVCKASHSILALSYLFIENNKPGKFSEERAEKLGVPKGKMWHDLQHGKQVKTDKGLVGPEQVLGKERTGMRVGISGDTQPSDELEVFFTKCDYLVFDSTFGKDHKQRALKTGHSTAGDAAKLANNAKVKNLILTHFSSRYRGDELLKEAQDIHGSVIAAKDLLEIEL